MRELTKAFCSFSIAMAAFGPQQVLNLVQRPIPGAGHPTTTGLDSVSQAAGQQLDGYLRQAFEAGDRVQRSTVDLAYGVLTGEVLNPTRLVTLSSNVLWRSAEAMRQLVPGVSAFPSPQPAPGGPGASEPMPPASRADAEKTISRART